MKGNWMQRMLVLLLTGLAVSACGVESLVTGAVEDDVQVKVNGSGRPVEESRPVSGFTAISLYTEGQVTIVQGDAETLTIETDDNLVEYIETTVSDGVLDIRLREGADVDLEPTNGIRFEITTGALDALDLYGAGALIVGDLATDRLSLKVSGAGVIRIRNLAASELDVMLAGAGSVVVAGEVGREQLTLAGVGDIDVSNTSANQVTVALSGMGDVAVWAIDRLDATIAGIGDVDYYGSPSVTERIPGSGKVNHMGDK